MKARLLRTDLPIALLIATSFFGVHVSEAQEGALRITHWHTAISLRLNAVKQYPAEARRNDEEGVVQVKFELDRDSNLVSRSILQSSGFASLDDEALATVDRAQPFPLPPEDAAKVFRDNYFFVIPLRFRIPRDPNAQDMPR